jgi:A1 cistron-splicing factor AAR2
MDAITPAILLLNLPPSALGGMDLLSFTTTPKFQGIKNIPPGLHFVFVGSTSTLSVRHGIWIKVNAPSFSGPPDFFIRKWDTSSEELVAENDVTTLLQQRANLGRIWRDNLTPYRQSASQDDVATEESNRWVQMTDCITEALLSRVLDTDAKTWTLTSSSSAKQDFDDIPGLSSSDLTGNERELCVLPVDLKQTWRLGATGRERTEAAQDRSWALTDLSTRFCNNDMLQIIGELQFCFVMVLTLNNYSCLEQWRRILDLIFTCISAVSTHPSFFVRALATLKLQLQHGQDVETGLFDLSDDGATFLKSLLLRFKKALDRLPGNAHEEVTDELDDLLAYVQETLGWQISQGSFARTGMLSLEDGEEVEMDNTAFDEDDEAGEYAPTIVELSAEQMRLLGIEEADLQKVMSGGNKTPNLRDRLQKDRVDAGRDGYQYEVQSDEESEKEVVAFEDDDEEEELDLEDMDARY